MIQIKKLDKTSQKIKLLLYGASGSGKTSFAGTAKNVLFLSAENGLLSIVDKGIDYVNITSMNDLREALQFLKQNPTKYATVVIDSVTEINEIIKADIEKRTGKAMQIQDWGNLSKQIREILRSFRDLDLNCIFICQEMTEKEGEEGNITRRLPSLNGKNATEIAYFMDIVAYTYIDKTGTHKIITKSSDKLLTKDRSRVIGNDTEPDFEKWVEKMKGVKIVDKENVVDSFTGETTEASTPATPPVKLYIYKNLLTTVDDVDRLKKGLALLEVMTMTEEIENVISQFKSKILQLEGVKKVETAETTEPIENEEDVKRKQMINDLLSAGGTTKYMEYTNHLKSTWGGIEQLPEVSGEVRKRIINEKELTDKEKEDLISIVDLMEGMSPQDIQDNINK